jgi:hypothetical protein
MKSSINHQAEALVVHTKVNDKAFLMCKEMIDIEIRCVNPSQYETCIGCRIEDELMDGLQYWRLEQSLCTALSTREEASSEEL